MRKILGIGTLIFVCFYSWIAFLLFKAMKEEGNQNDPFDFLNDLSDEDLS